MKNSFDFFLNCTFCCFWWWEPFPLACLELFLLCWFFTSFPLASPLFKKKKNPDATQLLPTLALFADSIKSSQKQRR
jgi:hypothetical protein